MKNCLCVYHNLHKTNVCVRSWDFCSCDGSYNGILDFNNVFLPKLCTYQSQGLTGYSPTHLCYILHTPAASQPIQLEPLSDWLSISNTWIGAYPAYQNFSLFGRRKPVNARCQARILACKMWILPIQTFTFFNYMPMSHQPSSVTWKIWLVEHLPNEVHWLLASVLTVLPLRVETTDYVKCRWPPNKLCSVITHNMLATDFRNIVKPINSTQKMEVAGFTEKLVTVKNTVHWNNAGFRRLGIW